MAVLTKFVQPEITFDSSITFLKNVAFDSSVFLRSFTHISSPVASSNATPYALLVESIGANIQIKSRQLGTMAWETATNYATLTYVDGSLGTFKTYVDGSLNAKVDKAGDTMTGLLVFSSAGFTLDSATITGIDTSAEGISTSESALATSAAIYSYNAVQDAAITALENASVKSWNGLTTSVDNSIGLGGPLNIATTITANSTNTLTIAGLVTSTANTPLAVVMDAANQQLKVRQLGTMAWETAANYATLTYVDGSLGTLKTYVDGSLGIRDASITELFGEVDQLDASIGVLYTYIDGSLAVRDSSIILLFGEVDQLDASVVELRGLISDLSTGSLIDASNGLSVIGQVVELGGDLYKNTDIDTTDYYLSVTGDFRVIGDLTVDGSVTYINSVNLNVSDNIITINSGETGSGVTKTYAGIAIDRGLETNYFFGFSEIDETFRIGIQNEASLPTDTQAVATRQDTPTDKGIAHWNATAFRFDTREGFTFDDSGLSIPAVLTDNNENTSLMLNSSGTVVKRDLGTMAFQTAANYATLTYVDGSLGTLKTYVDGSLGIRDASITALFGITSDISTNKLNDVAMVSGIVGGYDIYAGTTANVARLKKIIAGSGAAISEDASTITIAVQGAAGFVSKYSSTFDGTASSSLTITAATHELGTGPFNVSVYDKSGVDSLDQVYTGVTINGAGDVTLDWTPGSLSNECTYIIAG